MMTISLYFLGEYTIDVYEYFIGLLPDLLLLVFTVCVNICFYIIGLNGEKISATHKVLKIFFPFLLALGTLIVYAFLYSDVCQPEIHISVAKLVFFVLNMVLFIICYMRFYLTWKQLYSDSEQG